MPYVVSRTCHMLSSKTGANRNSKNRQRILLLSESEPLLLSVLTRLTTSKNGEPKDQPLSHLSPVAEKSKEEEKTPKARNDETFVLQSADTTPVVAKDEKGTSDHVLSSFPPLPGVSGKPSSTEGVLRFLYTAIELSMGYEISVSKLVSAY